MKILESEVSFLSSHKKHKEVHESESLEHWDREEDAPQRLRQLDRLELSGDFKQLHMGKELGRIDDSFEESSLDPKLMSIVRALEALTGKRVDISFLQRMKPGTQGMGTGFNPDSGEQIQRVGWGIDYRYEKVEISNESLEFSAMGSVKTERGDSIEFSMAMSMKNSSEIRESISFKAGDALIDPLVLNFGSDTVSISELKHKFDLDLDGKSEEFSFVAEGSGFLAMDKNKDGTINDGSELFGPTLGNGFKELRAYDSDSNGWIDENDAVFDELLIWTKSSSGEENLYSLKEKNVGALYLGAVSSEFDLNANDGIMQARLKESSVYLKENGGIGTLQEIDLVV